MKGVLRVGFGCVLALLLATAAWAQATAQINGTVTDASGLQAELQTAGVDIAPAPSNMPPDTLKLLSESANLKAEQFDGSNIQYIGMNTTSAPLDNVKIRQAVGYAIDRDKLIKELLSGQA